MKNPAAETLLMPDSFVGVDQHLIRGLREAYATGDPTEAVKVAAETVGRESYEVFRNKKLREQVHNAAVAAGSDFIRSGDPDAARRATVDYLPGALEAVATQASIDDPRKLAERLTRQPIDMLDFMKLAAQMLDMPEVPERVLRPDQMRESLRRTVKPDDSFHDRIPELYIGEAERLDGPGLAGLEIHEYLASATYHTVQPQLAIQEGSPARVDPEAPGGHSTAHNIEQHILNVYESTHQDTRNHLDALTRAAYELAKDALAAFARPAQ